MKIAEGVDVLPLQLDLYRQPALWNERPARTAAGGWFDGTDDIWLRFREPAELTSREAFAEPFTPVFYPAWHALPHVRPLVFDIMRRVEAVQLGAEVAQVQRREHLPHRHRPRHRLTAVDRQLDILDHRQIRQQVALGLLPDEADSLPPVAQALGTRQRCQVVARDGGPPRARPVEAGEHAEQLVKDGFKVLPYTTEDLVLCQRLVDVGCQAVMPWAAPIGTGKGPINPHALRTLRERLDVPMIVDAGLGLPSHACQVMEWGFDAVLLNTAVALAQDPIHMAKAFADAVNAGRAAYRSGAMQAQDSAQPSTPVLGTPFWHQA